ncbi:MAG TPA: tryptophan--tRNA ligase [Thermoplasmatales archaeon]|nr:tryptophan--tRNA ligase [Thermoplasmatales archaeon]
MIIDPWSSQKYEYEKLFENFGIEKFDKEIWKDLPDLPFFFRRKIVFGHRDFQKIKYSILRNGKWAILTGLMPSGKMHFGHKIVIDQVIYYQSIGADINIAVADIEAYATRGYSLKEAEKLAIDEYITNYIALGLKPCRIYFQSKNEDVKDLAYLLAKKANLSQLNAIYGFKSSTNMAHVFAPFIQTGDILHVQMEKYGGLRPTLVPVGVDQDPHIRFCRDLADAHRIYSIVPQNERTGIFVKIEENVEDLLKEAEEVVEKYGKVVERNYAYKAIYAKIDDLNKLDYELAKIERKYGGYGFISPSSTYHRFISGLDGNKMSSSRPQYALFLTDTPDESKKKIWSAKTGGAISAEEQKKHGGKPEECMIYELFMYGLIKEDKELEEIYKECKDGKLLCGECKRKAYELIKEFLEELKEKREIAKEKIKDYIQ